MNSSRGKADAEIAARAKRRAKERGIRILFMVALKKE